MTPIRDESGMTLIELIICVVITVLLVGAAATAFAAGLTNSGDTTTAFAESHDSQLLSSYLPADIQSAKSVVPAFDTTSYCGISSTTNLVEMSWTQTSTTYTVDYRIEQEALSGGVKKWALVRYSCDTAHVAGTYKKLLVAHELLDPIANASTWMSGGTPATLCSNRVAVKLYEASGYSFTISGDSRNSTGAAACTVPADFAVSISPSSQTAGVSSSATYIVTVTPTSSFSGPVTLSSPNLVTAGFTPSFSPNPLTFASPGSSVMTSTLTVPTGTTTGTTTFNVVATSGATSHTAGASLTVSKPDLLQVEMYDGRGGTPNGKIDELFALFSAPVNGSCISTTAWALNNPPTDALVKISTVSFVPGTTPANTALDIKLNEGSFIDTAASAFTVNFTSPAGCNANSSDPVNPVDVLDRAGPIATTVSTPSGNAKPGVNDQIQIAFSEAIAAASCPSTTTVNLQSANDGPRTTSMTLSGISQTPVTVGEGYLKDKSSTLTFSGSIGCGGSTLTITLTSCGATCGEASSGSSSSYSLKPDDPAITITDAETPVPNKIVTTVAATGGALF